MFVVFFYVCSLFFVVGGIGGYYVFGLFGVGDGVDVEYVYGVNFF